MRIYKPAGTIETLERLLAEPEIAGRLVEHRVLPERAAQTVQFPSWLDKRLVRALHGQGIEMLYTHQAESLDGAARWRGHRRRHADCVGQVAVLQPAGAAGGRRGSGRPGALPVPDQGAQPGPAGRRSASWLRPPRSTSPPASTTATRRSRSARTSDQPARWWSPTRTCSTARSCPITPSGSSCSSSCATSSSTRRTPTAASSASHVANVLRRLLRLCDHYGSKPQIILLLGDDRQPAGAGRDADRPAGHGRRPQRRAGRREARRHPQPAGHRRAPGHPARAARRCRTQTALGFLRAGRQTIVFGKARVAVELLLTSSARGIPRGSRTA